MASVASTEARRSGRVSTNLQMELLLESQSGKKMRQNVLIVNMSLLGVGIRLCGALLPEQTVTLIPSDRSFNVYPCRVVWIRLLGSDLYSEVLESVNRRFQVGLKPLGSEIYSEVGLEFWGIAKLIPV
jgi:hypothetical protein